MLVVEPAPLQAMIASLVVGSPCMIHEEVVAFETDYAILAESNGMSGKCTCAASLIFDATTSSLSSPN
jgi:hypothetical protein